LIYKDLFSKLLSLLVGERRGNLFLTTIITFELEKISLHLP